MDRALKLTWRKSSHSGGQGADCVEMAWGSALHLRDSKAPNSGMLSFADTSASAFLAAVKAGLHQR